MLCAVVYALLLDSVSFKETIQCNCNYRVLMLSGSCQGKENGTWKDRGSGKEPVKLCRLIIGRENILQNNK